MNNNKKLRGEAYSGNGYGSLRFRLFQNARKHIEKSIDLGFHCEAISIIESIISDRLESRLSYLSNKNFGFSTLGGLIKELRKVEEDEIIISLLIDLDKWREVRNSAIHELCKVEAGKELKEWNDRIKELENNSQIGYDLLKKTYNRIADLNPKHFDRVFGHSE